MKYVVLASSLLMSCALELPGSGPSGAEEITARGPIVETPRGAPAMPPSSTPPSGDPPASAQPVAVEATNTPGAAGGTGTPAASSPADAGLDGDDAGAPEPPDAIDAGVFTLSSSAFDDGARLPSAFTCRGADDSPPLFWSDAPADAKSFALVLTSMSARAGAAPQVEWVLWGIPATRSALPHGVDAGRQPSNLASAQQHSPEGAGMASGSGGPGAGPWVGPNGGGMGPAAGGGGPGSPGMPGAPAGVEAERPPRYRGPCGSSPEQLEFTLFALAAGAPRGGSMNVEAVEEWLETREHVLAAASLSATFP